MVAKHESFQLWESPISGVLLQKNNDFVTFNKQGLLVTALGSIQKRMIQDNEENDRMIHSLDSVDFLKVDPENYILFECADDEKVISVE